MSNEKQDKQTLSDGSFDEDPAEAKHTTGHQPDEDDAYAPRPPTPRNWRKITAFWLRWIAIVMVVIWFLIWVADHFLDLGWPFCRESVWFVLLVLGAAVANLVSVQINPEQIQTSKMMQFFGRCIRWFLGE